MASYGYADGSVQTQQWAAMWEYTGKVPVVKGDGDWNVAVVLAATRTVRIAAGTGAGEGILDITTTTTDIALPVVTGAAKYATIVAHRDWATNTTTFKYIGQATTPIVSTLDDEPGVKHDQVLAIVRTKQGFSQPDLVIDKRVTLKQARTGWFDWQTLDLASGLEYAGHGHSPRFRLSIDGNGVELQGAIARTGVISGGVISPRNLNNSQVLGQLPSEAIPAQYRRLPIAVSYGGGASDTAAARVDIDSTGSLTFVGGGTPAWASLDGCRFERD